MPYTRRAYPAPLPRSHQERLTQEIAQHRCILVNHEHSFRFFFLIILRSTVTPTIGSRWNAMHARQSCSGKRMPALTGDRHERSGRLQATCQPCLGILAKLWFGDHRESAAFSKRWTAAMPFTQLSSQRSWTFRCGHKGQVIRVKAFNPFR